MRNRTLHAALEAFTEEAAEQLDHDAREEEELPFEVIESPGTRTPLYCYRPLTGRFITQRMESIGRLPTYLPAARALQSVRGLDDYLRARGEVRVSEDPTERADAALRAFLASTFSEASEFEFRRDRFGRAYRQLEAVVYEGRALAAVIVPVLGLTLESDEVPLGEGFSLVRGETLADAPAEALWSGAPGPECANPIAVFGAERAEEDSAPITAARLRFRRLQTALRLWDSGGMTLAPMGWSRIDAGPWTLVPLGGNGRPHRSPIHIPPQQEDELRGFCNLIASRAPAGGELGWALTRFEMGCERVAPFEALTDFLLALRALLEPEGPGSGRLAQRLAAICAPPSRRPVVIERVAHAISLERAAVAGIAPAEPGVDALVEDVGGHLRALLRDVLCGHLDADLVGVADEILEEPAEDEASALSETV